MANITKTFTYALPDEYLAQTNELEKTGEWTYEGPAYLYVFVKNDTGLIAPSQSFIPVKDTESSVEEARIRAGLDQTAVLLDVANNDTDALIASIFISKDTGASTDYPQKEYKLEDGTVYYSRPEPTAPNHTYDGNDISYDFETGTWQKPFPWFKPWMTTEQHMGARDAAIAGCRDTLNEFGENLTPAQIVEIEAFITEMEDLYEKFAGVEPHMIPFLDDPTMGLIEGYDYNEDPDGLLA